MEHLSVEFAPVLKRQPDLVFRLENGRLLHLEIQVSNHTRMAWRMLHYHVLLAERYPAMPIEQVVPFAGNEELTMADGIESPALWFRFPMHDLREFPPERFLESPVPAERALAVLCGCDDARLVIRRILQSWSKLEYRDISDLLEKLAILSGLRHLEDGVREELPTMAIDTEYLIQNNDFFREWKELGLKEGREKGREEGRAQGKAALVRRLATQKFGELPGWALGRLDQASEAELDDLAVAILTAASIEVLFQ